MVVWGVVLTVLALLSGLASVAGIVISSAGSLANSMSAPVFRTPVDREIAFETGQYVVFQQSSAGGSEDPGGRASLRPADVEVIGPHGIRGTVTDIGLGTQVVDRPSGTFVGAALIRIPVAGTYRVRVDRAGTEVFVARGLGHGMSVAIVWVVVGLVAGAVLVLGTTLVGIGLMRGRGERVAGPADALG
jgi:hypothetical protein